MYVFGCLFLFLFLGPPPWHMKVPRLGVESSCNCRPTPQPQPCGIWAASATYITTHGNAGSLTHWVRLGIEPESSRMLVGFVSAVPQWELPDLHFYLKQKKQQGINSSWLKTQQFGDALNTYICICTIFFSFPTLLLLFENIDTLAKQVGIYFQAFCWSSI